MQKGRLFRKSEARVGLTIKMGWQTLLVLSKGIILDPLLQIRAPLEAQRRDLSTCWSTWPLSGSLQKRVLSTPPTACVGFYTWRRPRAFGPRRCCLGWRRNGSTSCHMKTGWVKRTQHYRTGVVSRGQKDQHLRKKLNKILMGMRRVLDSD